MQLLPPRPTASPISLLLAGLLLLAPAALFAQEPKPVFEEWMVLFLDGKQCGYGSTITTKSDTSTGPQFCTVDTQQFVVKRLSVSLTVTETSKIIEDADGAVLSFDQSTSGVGTEMTSHGVREGDDLVVTSRGQTQRYHLPRLNALGPQKIRQMTNDVPLKPGQPFSFNTFMSDYPQNPVVAKGSIVDQEDHDVRGTTRKLWKINNELSIMPGITSVAWVDDQNNDVELVTPFPGLGDLHEYVTTRAECMKEPQGVEMFSPTLIHPSKPIESPASLAQAVYRLSLTDLDKKLILWDQGEQKVVSSGPGTCEVVVTTQHITPDDTTWQLPCADTPELHPYLQSSSYLESGSPEIQALAKQAVGEEKNPVRAAHQIEQFVRDYITKKDLSIGFASAEETAKSREGDCTEHAVLCAAIGRAAGLPTRCVVGFGYLPPGAEDAALSDQVDDDTGIFGFHMWAEAWIGPDKWVPMDAAMNGFDVGHIAIVKTSMADINPLVDLQAPLLQLMNNLKIDVVKTVPKGKTVFASKPQATSPPASTLIKPAAIDSSTPSGPIVSPPADAPKPAETPPSASQID